MSRSSSVKVSVLKNEKSMYFSGLVVRWLFSRCYIVNPRTYLKFITPLWYKGEGGVDGTPPQSFLMLQYFETICLQWKAFDLLNKMRYILFWRTVMSQKWFPSWLLSWILPSIRNQVKTSFHQPALLLLLKEVEKT